MKKKLVVFITTLILAVVSVFGITVAVAETKSSALPKASKVYIQKFERFMDMFNCGFENFYGKIDLSEEYKTEGKTSAKMTVYDLDNVATAPRFHVDAYREDYGYDARDFGMIDYVGFSIKNGNDFDSVINFYVLGEDGGKIVQEYCYLSANESKDFKVKVNRITATINSERATSFEFLTDVSEGVWYFDGLYVETAYSPIIIEDRDFNKSDMLMNFDSLADTNYIANDQTVASSVFVTETSISASNIAKNGKALKVFYNKAMEVSLDETIQPRLKYSGFKMGVNFMESFDFAKLTQKDLSVDVYNATGYDVKVIIRIEDAFDGICDKVVTISPNVWNTISINNAEMVESGVMADKIIKLAFYVDLEPLTESATVYFDNICLRGNAQ